MPKVTLYTPDRDNNLLDEAESLLETAYLDYNTELSNEVVSPKLEIKNDDSRKIYRGLKEIREGLETTDLDSLNRKFD